MDPQYLSALNESLALAERLRRLLERDNDEIAACLSGELMLEYRKGIEQAQELVTRLRSELWAMRGM